WLYSFTTTRSFETPFFPRFVTSLFLHTTDEFEQTCSPAANIDIVAGSKFPRLFQKSVILHRVENQFPIEMLLAWEHERNRFVMRINQEQKCYVTNQLAFNIDNIIGVTAQKHSQTTHQGRGPFLVTHFFATGIEPHHVLDLRISNPAPAKKFRPPKHRMFAPE